jgi:hypothetical protein
VSRRRREKLDPKDCPHVYVGPSTAFGLANDSPCKIVGKRAGGKVIRTRDGRDWVVGGAQVKKRSA